MPYMKTVVIAQMRHVLSFHFYSHTFVYSITSNVFRNRHASALPMIKYQAVPFWLDVRTGTCDTAAVASCVLPLCYVCRIATSTRMPKPPQATAAVQSEELPLPPDCHCSSERSAFHINTFFRITVKEKEESNSGPLPQHSGAF